MRDGSKVVTFSRPPSRLYCYIFYLKYMSPIVPVTRNGSYNRDICLYGEVIYVRNQL